MSNVVFCMLALTHELTELLSAKIVEIDTIPDLKKFKPVVLLKHVEVVKLLKQLQEMSEVWLALKYNETIFIIWREFIFSTQNKKAK